MFIRKSLNRSGNIGIQVVEKRGRQNRIVKHIGTGRTPVEKEQLIKRARKFIDDQRMKSGIVSFFDNRFNQSRLEEFLSSVSFIQVLDMVTYRFIYHFYQTVGFHKIKDDCFADLVIARIVEPLSKRQTRDFLKARFGRRYPLNRIYKTLRNASDKNYKDKVEKITHQFIKKHINESITVLFFDVTTLCFEAQDEDEVKKYGFSKDCRVFIFGSWAEGTALKFSDIDIGVEGKGPFSTLELEEAFENSDLPYLVEIVNFNHVSEKFKKVAKQKIIPLN
jgi:predicted nucleotidyltransferase